MNKYIEDFKNEPLFKDHAYLAGVIDGLTLASLIANDMKFNLAGASGFTEVLDHLQADQKARWKKSGKNTSQ